MKALMAVMEIMAYIELQVYLATMVCQAQTVRMVDPGMMVLVVSKVHQPRMVALILTELIDLLIHLVMTLYLVQMATMAHLVLLVMIVRMELIASIVIMAAIVKTTKLEYLAKMVNQAAMDLKVDVVNNVDKENLALLVFLASRLILI
jgi:hypothetical protein